MGNMHTPFAANAEVAQLLASCEEDGSAVPYAQAYDAVETFDARDEEILVVSDLHLGAGLGEHKTYAGTENFFADSAFARFLAHKKKTRGKKRLIINGDFVDFLRITNIPQSSQDLRDWLAALKAIDPQCSYTVEALESTIAVEQREKYGLKTNDFKSIWKLLICARGHAPVFDALAEWIADDHELIIVKGNHDLEWYWPAVRNFFRLLMVERVSRLSETSASELIRQQHVLKRMRFIENALLINRSLYIEHGHHYDNYSRLVPPDERELKALPGELNISFGSFFNRYVLNKLELKYSYYDNVRPRTSLFPMLIKKDFPLAVRVFAGYIPRFIKSVRKRYYGALFGQAILLLLALLIPIGIAISQLWPWINNDVLPALTTPAKINGVGDYILNTVLGGIKSIAWIALAYPLARLVAALQLVEESSLLKYATKIFAAESRASVVVMGHTHNPEQYEVSTGQFFYNTGAWIPIIEASSASIREDRTYTFIAFSCDADGSYTFPSLKRWNDDADREEDLPLIADPDYHTATKQPNTVIERLRWLGAKP